MNGSGGKSRRLTEGERILWREITRSIAPLRSQPADEVEQAVDAKERAQEVSSPPRSAKPQPARPKVQTPPVPAPLGRRAKLRVAQGREAIDGRLDLHGLTQAEAHGALLRFLHTAQARGARLVMVITGKGRGEGGVLKRQVPLWLALPEFRGKVIGFEQAHQRHGGEGALYLRVRKIR